MYPITCDSQVSFPPGTLLPTQELELLPNCPVVSGLHVPAAEIRKSVLECLTVSGGLPMRYWLTKGSLLCHVHSSG